MAMKHFYVGVKAVITKGNNVFLVKGVGDRDFWDCPGGRIDDNESIFETLDRELHEEIPNITSYDTGQLLHAVRVHRDIADDVSLVLLFFHVQNLTCADDTPSISDEHIEGKWFDITEALTICKDNVADALRALPKQM